MKAGRLTELFNGPPPGYTKHAKLEITYLVKGTPISREDIPKLEPNVTVEMETNARPRPNTSKAPFGKG
jgi:hypothetical protein